MFRLVFIGVHLHSWHHIDRYKRKEEKNLFGPCSSVSNLGDRVRDSLLAVKLFIFHLAFYNILQIHTKSCVEKNIAKVSPLGTEKNELRLQGDLNLAHTE